MTRATGIGSLPGTDIREAVREVRDSFTEPDLPYLPELPGRGPGADLVGRTAGLLAGLAVDLQPAGWRFVDRPGHDASRTRSLWRQDLDEFAEAFDGYAGDLKIQVCGPWTLAATIELTRGERALIDDGATRDVVGSLAEGLRRHLADLQRLVPDARFVVQLDEPALPSVLGGSLPTASGFGRVRAVERQRVADGLREVVEAAGERPAVIHCCHPDVPIPLLRNVSASAVAIDTSLLRPAQWEALGESIEAGTRLYAGCLPTDATGTARAAVAGLADRWSRLGLPVATLDDMVVTPACGLAGLTPDGARSVQRAAREAARELTDLAHG
ncbi:MAG: methionine synthase [Nostocoides sp.]